MPPLDDIPQAARDVPWATPSAPPQGRGRLPKWAKWLLWVGSAAALAVIAGGITAWYEASGGANLTTVRPIQGILARPEQNEPAQVRDRAITLAPASRTLLGHHAYDQAPEADLVALTSVPAIRLRSKAAEQFEAMRTAAAQAGVRLVPLSGFRSYNEQEAVFFNLKAERHQDAKTRAEISAPPGYSEHHTGYAIDLGDAKQPQTHLDQSFGETAAYQWLASNAVKFGFELSFPPDNLQGVAFEPWHWRFVGDRHSLETFYQE
jgi:D-alanyl-D-alanine carboxypeptidase